MYLLGLTLPDHKRVSFALRRFQGIGPYLADVICGQAYIHPMCKIKELKESQVNTLRELIQTKLEAERQLKLAKMKASKKMAMINSTK